MTGVTTPPAPLVPVTGSRAWSGIGVAVAGVALPLAWWAPTRTTTVLVVTALAALAPLVGLWHHRPHRRGPWLAVSGMLTCWLVSLLLDGVDPDAAAAAQTLGLVIALGLLVALFTRARREMLPERRHAGRQTWGRRTDQLVIGTVVLLALSQSVDAALSPGTPWSVVTAPFDVVLICLLLRFVASRADLSTSKRFIVAGAVCAAGYDCLLADAGAQVLTPHDGLGVLWVLAMCLFLAGSLHPSMPRAFPHGRSRRMRSESARLLGLIPMVALTTLLSLMNSSGRLSTHLYVVAGAVVAGLAIARGAQVIAYSEEQARRDPLTGLANRRGLRTAFDHLPLPPSPSAVIGRLVVLDLDDFKHVNDTYGHEAGDALINALGARLADVVGGHGTVARSGGDEFALLLQPGAPEVADVLQATFGPAFPLDTGVLDRSFTLRCSAGWVELTGTSDLWRSLADADVALYSSKQGGRGTAIRFEPAMREAVLGQLALTEDLRALLRGESGAGELVLLFQPLVSLPDARVRGCEALVRWAHPTLGLLGPDEFLPLAEVQGNGAALDTWVLHRACATAADWAAQGLPWTISVNLGRSSMVDPELRCRVESALSTSGLRPERLHLEITEHDQLPADAGVQALRALAAAGVRVSLDDFGTGYTSLVYLQRYPVSVLKLDRSVTGVDSPTELLTGVIGLADALGITVLAEGIETDEQCHRLAGLGVDHGQGWLFGHPVPAAELPGAVEVRTP